MEYTFGVFAELVVGFIYGALAAVMGSLMMGLNVGEKEYAMKMASVKGWMRAKDLGKQESLKILNYYRATHKGNSVYDEAAILG